MPWSAIQKIVSEAYRRIENGRLLEAVRGMEARLYREGINPAEHPQLKGVYTLAYSELCAVAQRHVRSGDTPLGLYFFEQAVACAAKAGTEVSSGVLHSRRTAYEALVQGEQPYGGYAPYEADIREIRERNAELVRRFELRRAA